MLNIQKVENAYLACGFTDLRKSVNGLSIIVESKFKMATNKRKYCRNYIKGIGLVIKRNFYK